MSSFELRPDRFVPGTVGEPGSRIFYLQAVQGTQVVSVRLEKQQVAALAEYLAGLLADLPSVEPQPTTGLDLVEPVVAEWVVGSLAVAFEEANDELVVVAQELVETDDDTGEPLREPSSLRVNLSREHVDAFIRRAVEVVSSGRPPCPICGRPIDPEGHVCPRSNGHGRH